MFTPILHVDGSLCSSDAPPAAAESRVVKFGDLRFQFELRVRKELLKQIHEAYAESEGEEMNLQLVAEVSSQGMQANSGSYLASFRSASCLTWGGLQLRWVNVAHAQRRCRSAAPSRP